MSDVSRKSADSTERRIEFPALYDPRYPVSRIAKDLEPYVRRIVEQFKPEKVLLFGSQVRGEPDVHSDVDLLVVRRGFKSERDSDIEIRRSFRTIPNRRNLPFTILSKTPERLAECLAEKSPFFEEIMEQGVELYGQQLASILPDADLKYVRDDFGCPRVLVNTQLGDCGRKMPLL